MMDKQTTIFFNPKEGKFNFEKPEFFKRLASALPEKRFIMTIKEHRNNRSSNQSNYMWGVVYDIIAKELGYTTEEIHGLMGREFLAYGKKGEWFVKSTTSLNTKEMEEYLEKVRRFASMEFNCYIPLPNEPNNFFYEVK